MSKQAVILNIYGRVQGVGFRFYTQKKATGLKLAGYVKNMPDGSVYIEAEGQAELLEMFVNWCESGPSWARVTKVDKQTVPLTNYTGFKVR